MRIAIDVTFPVSRKTRSFASITAVAKMLSGTGTASGSLRSAIERKARAALYGGKHYVRGHAVYG
jgi:hypothetical protein